MRVLAHFSRPMLVVFLVCLFTGHVSAQSLSSMIGEVRDTTGAVIPDVVVTATHKGTGLTRSAEPIRREPTKSGRAPRDATK